MKTKTMYYTIRSIMGLSFHLMFTIAALYRIDVANLEVYELILLGSALEISVFLFEVPTGVVADLKSRRLSVIIGMFVISLGFALEAMTTYFALIFVSQVVWGFGYTFISGALDSWVSDELENRDIENVIITGAQMNKLFSFIGIMLAAIVGMFSIIAGIYVAAFMFLVLGILALIYMKENNFHKVKHELPLHKEYFGQLAKGIKHIQKHKVLKVMFLVMLFYGLYSEGIDRTYELHILDNLGFRGFLSLRPIWILSIVNGFVALIGLFALQVIKRKVKAESFVSLWAMNLTILMVVGVLLFALVPNMYVALFGFVFFSISREGTYPLLDTILIKHTPSKIKATVLSSFGQLDAIGQLMSGAIMVFVSLILGVKGVYIVTSLLLFVPVLGLLKVFRIDKNNVL